MKKSSTVVSCLFLSAAIFVVGCDQSSDKSAATPATTAPVANATTQPTTAPVAANGAINQYCAVETDNKIDPKGATYVYNGKTIGFCCPDCIDKFKSDPEKYMKTLH